MLRLLRSNVTNRFLSPLGQMTASNAILRQSARGFPTLGIRREDKSRWERRVPLSPDHVQTLVEQGIDVVVQPSTLRIFDDQAYQNAGAKVKEDLSEADAIVAVKEVPSELLLNNKTYLFFSHTIKAQQYNMPMLDTILQKKVRLIDYERIVDTNGQRLVRFGQYAGIAGMIDMIRALGNRLLYLHHSTPFLSMGYAHMYVSLDKAKEAVAAVGEEIALKGVPQELSPMIFVFTGGDGNCSQGAREIFELLPHKYVTMEELPALANSRDPGHRFRLYGCVVGSEHYMTPIDSSKKYEKLDYYAHPEKYKCVFDEKIAPYATVIINNTYWDKRFPRLLTTQQVKKLWKRPRGPRLIGVADISCDINGSIEVLGKTTNIDEPLFVYDPATGRTKDGIEGPGIVFLAVDNLPTELPREASKHFGDMLLPYLPDIVRSSTTGPFDKMIATLPAEVRKAVVTYDGKLSPGYEYINDLRRENEKKLNRILILGSGLVAPGLVNTLSQESNNIITIASFDMNEAKKMCTTRNISAVALDALKEPERLRDLIEISDLVISILPQAFHTPVAEQCIKLKKHMLTASYISPAMRQLDSAAKEAGVTILNEIGLDPGIDHMSAVKTINEIHEQGGKILHFKSVCGGLPAPEHSDNPLHYKFSWNPRGVLQACKNPAKFLLNGSVVDIAPDTLMQFSQPEYVHPCFSMEVLPNRDSLSYIDHYGLHESETVFRGTLRYTGFSGIVWALQRLNLLSTDTESILNPSSPSVHTWPALLAHLNKFPNSTNVKQQVEDLLFKNNVPSSFDTPQFRSRILRGLEWLGLFDESKEFEAQRTPIDTLCGLLKEALAYKKHERDMVLLQHTFEVEWRDLRRETLRSTLISFGDPEGESAMSKTVGFPLALAAQLILNKTIKTPGVLAPILPEIYNPVLSQLRDMGISFVEFTE